MNIFPMSIGRDIYTSILSTAFLSHLWLFHTLTTQSPVSEHLCCFQFCYYKQHCEQHPYMYVWVAEI